MKLDNGYRSMWFVVLAENPAGSRHVRPGRTDRMRTLKEPAQGYAPLGSGSHILQHGSESPTRALSTNIAGVAACTVGG